MPQTPGATINFNANIIISGFAGMKLEIVGFNLGIYSFSSNSITLGSYTNRAKVSIIECLATTIDFNNDYYEVNIISNQITTGIAFRYGNIVLNTTMNILLFDESQDNLNITGKNLITNNLVSNILGLYNNDYQFVISNNILKDISVRRWNANASIVNKIINNEFSSNSYVNFSSSNVPNYNILFSSNKFIDAFYCYNSGCWPSGIDYNASNDLGFNYSTWFPNWNPFWNGSQAPTGSHVYINGNWTDCEYFGLSTTNIFPNPNVSGFFEWSYNGININCPIPIAGQPLALTRIAGQTNDINGGNPNHNYYDIDLTINDRGRNGGPYSLLNYNPISNPNNSKAFIFDLDMPTDLFPGQSIDIKAKGYHKN